MKLIDFRNGIKPGTRIELYLEDGEQIPVTADNYAPIWVLNREVIRSECVGLNAIRIFIQKMS